ncbi:MAG TPA: nuclear transport factor 2 family protein [Acidimicrobiales bacterium]|nr:nuclear transport factor 2 family protein [Acidimicrobiales bacterium]
MPVEPLPPVAAVVSFIDAVNRADLDRLAALMHVDHRLVVLDEEPVVGRAANIRAWHGYLSSFPSYVIHPRRIVGDGPRVAVLGTTTGSHLGLPDEEESRLAVIWLAEVESGTLLLWEVADDTPGTRERAGIPDAV